MSRVRTLKGQETIKQIEHHDAAGAQATTFPVLTPGTIITPADLLAGTSVRNGTLLRVKVAGDTYVQFSESTIGAAPGAATPDALLIDATVNGGWHLIRACAVKADGQPVKDKRVVVRMSAAPSRAEDLGQ